MGKRRVRTSRKLNLDLRHIRELIRDQEWQRNNNLYLRRIKLNGQNTVKG
jgi:hypothetical protein